MRYSITTYIVISIASFLVLCGVQVYLVSNHYKLLFERYRSPGFKIIEADYAEDVSNDYLFPGGKAIIDTSLKTQIHAMEKLYLTNRIAYDSFAQKVCDSTARTLIKAQSIDSMMVLFKKHTNIHDSLRYALVIENIDVVFQKRPYHNIYTRGGHYPYIGKSIQKSDGLRIGGNLSITNNQNKVGKYIVSNPNKYTYRLTFALFVDRPDKTWYLMKKMALIFFLSVFSIFIVSMLFFVTFRNWLKQKKLSEMRSDFINSITHEFNTPLSTIIVANKNLQNPKISQAPGSINSLTNVIQRQTSRLSALVNRVLDLTTMHDISLDKKTLSLHELLDNILLDYKINMPDENVKLSFLRKAQQDIVSLDVFYFTTMINNILNNAVRYNNATIKTITIATVNSDKFILLSIADNGIGIDADTQKHIFEKFYRGTKTDVHGLGIGLYYVQQSVDAHKWGIEVKSRQGEGSTFTIKIPSQN